MMKTLFLAGCLPLVFSSASAAGPAPAQAVRCAKAPVIDGRLDDGCWRGALKFDRFSRGGGQKWETPLCAYLLCDHKNIYLAMRAQFPPGKSGTSAPARMFTGGDVFEVMIDANGTGDRYAHFAVNPAGRTYRELRGQAGIVADTGWNGKFQAAAYTGKNFWSAEFRIPYYSLEMNPEGGIWGFNFACSCAYSGGVAELSALKNGRFHSAGDFLPVAGITVDPARFAWKTGTPEFSALKPLEEGGYGFSAGLSVANLAPVRRDVAAILTVSGETGENVIAEQDIIFNAGERRRLQFPDLKIKNGGNFKVVALIRDGVNRAILARHENRQKLEAVPLRINLIRPGYRDAIFATQNLEEVEFELKSALPPRVKVKYTAEIRDPSGAVRCGKTIRPGETVRLPAKELPFGKLEIVVQAHLPDGKILTASHPLRKLPRKKGEVWRDEQGFWRRDGKRFWPIAEWGDNSTKGLNASFNDVPGCLRCDAVHAWGYSGPDDRKKYAMRKKAALEPADEELLRRYTRRDKDNPKLLLWFLVDEPDVRGISPGIMKQICAVIRDEDPYHPIMYGTYSSGVDYYGTGEINGLHPYPRIQKNSRRFGFAKCANSLLEIKKQHKKAPSIFYFTPGYNNGDCGSVDTRICSFDEMRTENLMAITMGGRGSMFYVWTGIHYPELYIGNTEYIKELHALEPALLADSLNDGRMSSGSPDIHFLVKQVGGEFWVFACSLVRDRRTASFTIPQLGDRKLHVFREGRAIQAKNGRFTDQFRNFDARIYTTDSRDFGLKTIAQVEAEIEAVYAKRRKPGNLAYQRYERDVMEVTASSNKFGTKRNQSNCLWHVTDGVTSGPPAKHSHGTGGILTWRDNTPGKTPDWLELRFFKPVAVGRAVVYDAENSLQDYQIQVWKNNAWKTVGEVKDARGGRQEVSFPKETVDRIRLYVTADRGTETIVHEIELYQQ